MSVDNELRSLLAGLRNANVEEIELAPASSISVEEHSETEPVTSPEASTEPEHPEESEIPEALDAELASESLTDTYKTVEIQSTGYNGGIKTFKLSEKFVKRFNTFNETLIAKEHLKSKKVIDRGYAQEALAAMPEQIVKLLSAKMTSYPSEQNKKLIETALDNHDLQNPLDIKEACEELTSAYYMWSELLGSATNEELKAKIVDIGKTSAIFTRREEYNKAVLRVFVRLSYDNEDSYCEDIKTTKLKYLASLNYDKCGYAPYSEEKVLSKALDAVVKDQDVDEISDILSLSIGSSNLDTILSAIDVAYGRYNESIDTLTVNYNEITNILKNEDFSEVAYIEERLSGAYEAMSTYNKYEALFNSSFIDKLNHLVTVILS